MGHLGLRDAHAFAVHRAYIWVRDEFEYSGWRLVTPCRIHVSEYLLLVIPVIFVGHLSTTSLAAITLGSMVATITGFSIVQGFTSALDTVLPATWTSSHPQLVGLWTQRMGAFSMPDFVLNVSHFHLVAVVMTACLVVSTNRVPQTARY